MLLSLFKQEQQLEQEATGILVDEPGSWVGE